jgi:hypothetical protein
VIRTIALTLLLAATAATAQQYIPSEEEKVAALKEAYRLNGNSMVGDRMIDLTAPRVVKTDRIMPEARAEDKNELDEAADNVDRLQQKWLRLHGDRLAEADVCARHHMHKVVRGTSWRCKR